MLAIYLHLDPQMQDPLQFNFIIYVAVSILNVIDKLHKKPLYGGTWNNGVEINMFACIIHDLNFTATLTGLNSSVVFRCLLLPVQRRRYIHFSS